MKDLARIYIKAGNGGDGSVHFHHGKYQPKGGPDGGDGGDGGDVVLVADENMANLVEFNFQKKFVVRDGEGGSGKNMHGKNSEDVVIKVPVGTVVYEISKEYAGANLRERETLEQVMKGRRLMVDMTKHGQRFEAAWGGKGGRGNYQFRSSTNQTPKEFEPGRPGDEKWLLLELKVVADIGIIGLPNVGKSSILKALTNANPKIAGYPFTTLEPNLGVMKLYDRKSSDHSPKSAPACAGRQGSELREGDRTNLVIVDVPGVVEEAWEGKGIGPWFLRHLERTKTLVHVLAPEITPLDLPAQAGHYTIKTLGEQLVRDYKIVRKELEKYDEGNMRKSAVAKALADKEEIVVINKMELVDAKDRKAIESKFKKETGKDLVWVSAGMGETGELVAILMRIYS